MKFGYLEGSHNPRSWGLTSSPWLWSPLTSKGDDPLSTPPLENPSPGWNFSNSRRRLHSADWPNQHLTFQAFALQWLWDPHQEPNSCPGAPLESSQTLNDMMIYLPTWISSIFMGLHVGKYTSPMDPMGLWKAWTFATLQKCFKEKVTQKYSPKRWAKGCWWIPWYVYKVKDHTRKSKKVVIAGSVILGHLPKFQAFLDLVASGERIWEWRKIGGWRTTFEVWLQNDVSINLCSFALHIKWRYQCCTLLCLMKGLPQLAQNSFKSRPIYIYIWGFP